MYANNGIMQLIVGSVISQICENWIFGPFGKWNLVLYVVVLLSV